MTAGFRYGHMPAPTRLSHPRCKAAWQSVKVAAARAAAVDADAVGLLDARDALQLAPAQARRRPHALERGHHTPWVRIAAPRACEICGTRSPINRVIR